MDLGFLEGLGDFLKPARKGNGPLPAAASPSSHLSRAPSSPLRAPLPAAAANLSSFFPPPSYPSVPLPAWSLRKHPRQDDEDHEDDEEEEQ